MAPDTWKHHILDVPDFPKPGITFKDVTPLLAHPEGLRSVIDTLAAAFKNRGVTQIVGVESRGFILGSALAYAMGVGLTLVRKPGKLPRPVYKVSYDLEYGSDHVEMHQDALHADDKAIIVDDVLATGGTAAAVAELVASTGAELVGFGFLIELDFLNGRDKLADDIDILTLIHVR